ncbi:MAG: tRNA (guanosine(46)-N7)-methyltransferase TrmB [bacterium]
MTDSRATFRPVRSYVLREGRLTKGQRRALDELLPRYRITAPATGDAPLDLRETFARVAPTHLEIGFGDGDALVQCARQNPNDNFIGAEVHRPGVGRLLLQLQAHDLDNVRVFCGDAVELLTTAIANDSLASIHLYFPDPWPKKKHHKRRIVQPPFINLVADKLIPTGTFHFATDWRPYAEQALELLQQSPRLQNQSGARQFTRNRPRPTTKFERRGRRLGHEVWDFVVEKVG